MYQTTVGVDGMMCGMCEAHVNDAVRSGGRIVAHTAELQRFIVRCGVRQDLRVLGHIKNEITIFAHSDTSLSFWGSMS